MDSNPTELQSLFAITNILNLSVLKARYLARKPQLLMLRTSLSFDKTNENRHPCYNWTLIIIIIQNRNTQTRTPGICFIHKQKSG
jgi:hypothetical protein